MGTRKSRAARTPSGVYRDPQFATEAAQFNFLQRARELCPEPLHHLRDDVYPLYRRWADKAALPPTSPVYHCYRLLKAEAPEVATALEDWSARFHLVGLSDLGDDPDDEAGNFWPLQVAAETLWAWRSWPNGAAMMSADPPEWVKVTETYTAYIAGMVPTITVAEPDWDETRESETAYRDRIHRAVDLVLDGRIEERRRFAERRGLRQHRGKYQPLHVDWLALYLCGWTYGQIANRHQEKTGDALGENAVEQGVHAAAAESRPRQVRLVL